MTVADWFGATVYYAGDGYSTAGPKIMGRQAAGQGFLRAYVNATRATDLTPSAWVTTPTRQATQEAMLGFKRAGLEKPLEVISPANMGALSRSGCLYVPQPGLFELASQRIRLGERQFSLCGITHTTASHAVMSTLAQLPVGPLRPWDALICTSKAVLGSVTSILEQQFEYLRWKLGATRFELPQLPVIPLGVHTQDYDFSPSQKSEARRILGLEENDVAVLFVGRLSFHAKAHPHPMMMALEKVAQQTSQKIHLIQAGWFANDAIEQAFKEASLILAPHVEHHYLDGRDDAQRKNAWAAADIFCSLADNIQETFGLTPIEAMAASLPVVVSDWDGYKDTVRHEVDGFRVSTCMPARGDGAQLAALYERGIDNYDMYCGKVCEFVAVDIGQATRYFNLLVTNKSLRRQMGRAARQRAVEEFDWERVFHRYQSLWHDLQRIRNNETKVAKQAVPISSAVDRPDPFTFFSSYATRTLESTTRLHLEKHVTFEAYNQTLGLAVHKYAAAVLPQWDQVQSLLEPLLDKDCFAEDILNKLESGQQRQGRLHLMWMMKVGWISVV